MKLTYKIIFLGILVILLISSCGDPINSLPSVHEMNEEAYSLYDGTTLSGEQVDLALKRYKKSLSIIIVKDGRSYLIGEKNFSNSVKGEGSEVEINKKGKYRSTVLRGNNNKTIGIKLEEWEN